MKKLTTGEKMKNKAIYLISIFMVVVLAACGPAPTPTMSAADIQGTAVAAAWTVVAMTEAAIPTATPVPPTETPSPTPLPTFTPLPPPTTSGFPTQSAPSNSPAGGPTADICNAPIAKDAAGHKINLNLLNKSDGTATISLYLQKTEFGECGIYSFVLSQGSNLVTVLEGCYWMGAFITGPKHQSKAFSNGYLCLTDPSHKWTVTVKNEIIGFFD